MDPETWDHVMFVSSTTPPARSRARRRSEIFPASRPVTRGSTRRSRTACRRRAFSPTSSAITSASTMPAASTASTGASRISFSEACATTETTDPALKDQYQDPFDVMGTGAHEENAYHRWESGWLPPSSAQTVVRATAPTCSRPRRPRRTPCSCSRCREVRGLPSYWLDFRQPLDGYFDNFLPTDPVVNGVSIRYANSSTMSHPSKSWLIDTTPATPSFNDAPLAVGQTYTDAARGVSITTLSVSPLGALVKISVANGADTTPSPAPCERAQRDAQRWRAAPGVDRSARRLGRRAALRRAQGRGAARRRVRHDRGRPVAGTRPHHQLRHHGHHRPRGQRRKGRRGSPSSVGDTTPPNAPTGLVASVSAARA